MSVSSTDIIGLAKTLQSGSMDEVQQRAVVGRAYYAAYHDCKTWHDALQSPGSAGIDGGVHARLIAALTNPTVRGDDALKSKKRGYRLRALKTLRAKADYELNETVTVDEAKQSIVDAEAVILI
jgi:uncharacterized protein (UPF0332 family)